MAGGSRSEAAAAGIGRSGPDSGTGTGAAEEPRIAAAAARLSAAGIPTSAASQCAPAGAAPPGRGARKDGAGGPGPLGCPAARSPGAVQGSAGGGRGRLLLATAGREQLVAELWLPLPGALRSGVPVQALRENWLLLFGSLCQLHLPVRPGLGGGPVPALPGQVQVSVFAGPRTSTLIRHSLPRSGLGVPGARCSKRPGVGHAPRPFSPGLPRGAPGGAQPWLTRCFPHVLSGLSSKAQKAHSHSQPGC